MTATATLPAAPVYAALIAATVAFAVQVMVKLWDSRSNRAEMKLKILIGYIVAMESYEREVMSMVELQADMVALMESRSAAAETRLRRNLDTFIKRTVETRNQLTESTASLLILFSDRTQQAASEWRSCAADLLEDQQAETKLAIAKQRFLTQSRQEVKAAASVGPMLWLFWARRIRAFSTRELSDPYNDLG